MSNYLLGNGTSVIPIVHRKGQGMSIDALVGTVVGGGVSIITTLILIRAEHKRSRREAYQNVSDKALADLYSRLVELRRIVLDRAGIFGCEQEGSYMREGRKAARAFGLEFERQRLFVPDEFETRMDDIARRLSLAYETIGYRYSSDFREEDDTERKKKWAKQAREAQESVKEGELAQDIKKLTDDMRKYMQKG